MILKLATPEEPSTRYYRRHFHSRHVGTKELAVQLTAKYRAWEAQRIATTRSHLATVSKQWQYFFEKLNFDHLFLHQEDVSQFRAIVERQPHRKAFVRWIWLRVELAEYSCQDCLTAQSPDEVRENNAIFTKGVYELFAVLSSWNPDDGHRDGITLELSAHSPSDATHFARELNFRIADNFFHAFRPLDMTMNVRSMLDSRRHSWMNGRQTLARRTPAEREGILARLFGDYEGLRFDMRIGVTRTNIPEESGRNRGLPPVPLIKSFLIRRQFYRLFSVSKALGPILTAMPELENLRYESWDTPMESNHGIRALQNRVLIGYILSRKSKLKAISIHGSTSRVYHGNPRLYDPRTLMPRDVSDRVTLGKALAKSTMNLQMIHGARNVEAEGFFHAFWPYDPNDETPTIPTPAQPGLLPTWQNLGRLSLTSTRLNPRDINWLLMAAGSAAQQMPVLVIMELWNYDPTSRCVFRYESHNAPEDTNRPEIEIMVSWWPRPPPTEATTGAMVEQTHGKTIPRKRLLETPVYECWQEVARRHCNDRVDLAVEVEYMNDDDWDGCVIQHLYQSRDILTSVSYCEMEDLEEWDVPT